MSGMAGMSGMADMGEVFGRGKSKGALAMKPTSSKECRLKVLFNPSIKKTAFTQIFSIVPGFVDIKFLELVEKGALATVTYDNPTSAEHARTHINGLEYPTDSFMEVTLFQADGQSDSSWGNVRNGSSNDAQSLVSVALPPKQPMADSESPVAIRLFFMMSGVFEQPPNEVIVDLFCRFGGLINAAMIRNRRCGYIRFANEKSAQACMITLNGATFMDRVLTVEVATEEHRPFDPKYAMQY